MIVRLPPFRTVTSGRRTFEALFGDFVPWQEQHNHLFIPFIFVACDVLSGTGDEFEWFWAVGNDVTEQVIIRFEAKSPNGWKIPTSPLMKVEIFLDTWFMSMTR